MAPTDSNPVPTPIPVPSWRQRPKPIGLTLSYRLDGEVLEIDSGRKVDRVRLSAVREVRFVYAPSNVSTKGFRTRLLLADGKTVTFGNLSWRSFSDVERDDAGYGAFVRALSAAVARANPNCRFVGGKPRLQWLALTAVSALSLAMLAFVMLRALQQGSAPLVFFGLALAAASWWQVAPMVRLNRPRPLATGEVPLDLVPAGPT